MNSVFVYGSLRRGQGNNFLLRDGEYIGEDNMAYPGPMMNLGAFPAVVKTNDTISLIQGEIYLVDDDVMDQLDNLEGYPQFYDREQRKTKSGHVCWIYYLPKERHNYARNEVPGGDWSVHTQKETQR